MDLLCSASDSDSRGEEEDSRGEEEDNHGRKERARVKRKGDGGQRKGDGGQRKGDGGQKGDGGHNEDDNDADEEPNVHGSATRRKPPQPKKNQTQSAKTLQPGQHGHVAALQVTEWPKELQEWVRPIDEWPKELQEWVRPIDEWASHVRSLSADDVLNPSPAKKRRTRERANTLEAFARSRKARRVAEVLSFDPRLDKLPLTDKPREHVNALFQHAVEVFNCHRTEEELRSLCQIITSNDVEGIGTVPVVHYVISYFEDRATTFFDMLSAEGYFSTPKVGNVLSLPMDGLEYSLFTGRLELCDYFLEASRGKETARIPHDHPDRLWKIPLLHVAALSCNTHALEWVVKKGLADGSVSAAFIMAASRCNDVKKWCGDQLTHSPDFLSTALYLMELGFDDTNVYPLSACSYHGHWDVVKLLIDTMPGANVNETTSGNKTLLHHAVEKGNLKMVEFLISKGADLSVRTSKGFTALDVALKKSLKRRGDKTKSGQKRPVDEIVDILQKGGAGMHSTISGALEGSVDSDKRPFAGMRFCLMGRLKKPQWHWTLEIEKRGGEIGKYNDCTHLVIADKKTWSNDIQQRGVTLMHEAWLEAKTKK